MSLSHVFVGSSVMYLYVPQSCICMSLNHVFVCPSVMYLYVLQICICRSLSHVFVGPWVMYLYVSQSCICRSRSHVFVCPSIVYLQGRFTVCFQNPSKITSLHIDNSIIMSACWLLWYTPGTLMTAFKIYNLVIFARFYQNTETFLCRILDFWLRSPE